LGERGGERGEMKKEGGRVDDGMREEQRKRGHM